MGPILLEAVLLLVALFGGLAGAYTMNRLMRSLANAVGEEVDMVKALGSFFTGRLENATRVGTFLHVASGLFFGGFYGLLFLAVGAKGIAHTLPLGIGIGFLHGLLMSYILMIAVSEKHPLEQFREVPLPVGMIHLVGHIWFGLVVGAVAGLAFTLA